MPSQRALKRLIRVTGLCLALVAIGLAWARLRFWRSRQTRTFPIKGTPQAIALSPRGDRIAYTSDEGALTVLTFTSSAMVARMLEGDPWTLSLAFSRSGDALAVGGRGVRLFDMRSESPSKTSWEPGPASPVASVACSL